MSLKGRVESNEWNCSKFVDGFGLSSPANLCIGKCSEPASRWGFRYSCVPPMDMSRTMASEFEVKPAEQTNAAMQRGEPKAGATWPDEIYRVLREFEVTQFAYVPDAGHKVLIDRSLEDPEVHSVALTTEEEGVGLLAGAHLGGERGVLLMQSSGVGNCINFLSLVRGGQFPFLMLVSMRGDFGEGNPWQVPMGRAVEPVLEAMGVRCIRADDTHEVAATVRAATTMVFQAGQAIAVLLTQKLIGAKPF